MPPDSGDRRGLSLKPPCDAVEALRQIVEREHRCIARPIGCVVVWELLRGAIVQERTVHTFDLLGHGAAPTAYAWNIGDQSIVMPHAGEVCGPAEAVGATLRWPRRPRR
jgi:hypothetical protein